MASDKQLRAFVLMPFDEALDWAYDRLIKPAFEEAGYAVVRADDIESQQNILKDIVTELVESDVIVADLTSANPNVYYELGLAHGLGKQVILLSQDVSEAPFDLRSYRIVEYGDRFDQFRAAQERLGRLAASIQKGEVTFGTPVSDFVPGVRNRTVAVADSSVEEDAPEEGIEEEGEPGLVDLVYDTEEGFAEQKELLEQAGKQITLLGEYATDATPRMKDLSKKQDYKGLRSLFKSISARYDARASDLHEINEKLRWSWERTADALEKRLGHSMTDQATRVKLFGNLRETFSSAAEAKVQIESLVQSVEGLPNIDKTLTRSTRKLGKELRGFMAYADDMASFEGRLEGVLEGSES